MGRKEKKKKKNKKVMKGGNYLLGEKRSRDEERWVIEKRRGLSKSLMLKIVSFGEKDERQ